MSPVAINICEVRAPGANHGEGERATDVGGALLIRRHFGVAPNCGQLGSPATPNCAKASFDNPGKKRVIKEARFDQVKEPICPVRRKAPCRLQDVTAFRSLNPNTVFVGCWQTPELVCGIPQCGSALLG